MNRFPNPSLDRRQLLRNGGLALSMGAVIAACGSDRGGSDDPGRLGVADPASTLPEGEVNDVVLLRTLQSLEYSAIEMYAELLEMDAFTDDETELVERFVTEHRADADELGTLIEAAGGETFECSNPFLWERAALPIISALEGTDDLHRDVLNIVYSMEMLVGASYQAFVTMYEEVELRSSTMALGNDSQRHATAMALVINPDTPLSPNLFGEPVEYDGDGFPVAYAIPSTFGQLTGINLVVGAPDAEAARYAIQLQTPAANSYVYDYLSC